MFITSATAIILGIGVIAVLLANTMGDIPPEYAPFVNGAGLFLALVTIVCLIALNKKSKPAPKVWMINPNWLDDAIFISDLNGNFIGANEKCQSLTLFSEDTKTAHGVFARLHDLLDDRSQADDILDTVSVSPDLRFTDTLQLTDGRTIERSTHPVRQTSQRLWKLRDVTQSLRQRDDSAMHQTLLEADAARTAELAEQLYHAKAELEARQAELTRLANTDSLTGLLNRRKFTILGAQIIENASSDHIIWAIVMDIDHFKRVNDTYGHAAGDVAIRDFATIASHVIGESGFIGRMGGEEFAALLPNCSQDDAYRKAEQVRKKTAAHQTISGSEKFRFTVSVGVAHHSTQDISIETVLDHADKALYTAKTYGRNRVVGYE